MSKNPSMLTIVPVMQLTTMLTTSSAMPFPIPRDIHMTNVTIESELTMVVTESVTLFTNFNPSSVIFLRSLSSSIIKVMFTSVLESTFSIEGFVSGPWKIARTRKLSTVRFVFVIKVANVRGRCDP